MPLCSDADAGLDLQRCFVESVELAFFRNFPSLKLSLDPRPVILTGPNGAGKTNLMEAISCLAAGRGLRRAKIGDLAYHPVSSSVGFSPENSPKYTPEYTDEHSDNRHREPHAADGAGGAKNAQKKDLKTALQENPPQENQELAPAPPADNRSENHRHNADHPESGKIGAPNEIALNEIAPNESAPNEIGGHGRASSDGDPRYDEIDPNEIDPNEIDPRSDGRGRHGRAPSDGDPNEIGGDGRGRDGRAPRNINPAKALWRIRARLCSGRQKHDIESRHILSDTGLDRRQIRIDGCRVTAGGALSTITPMLWMTPDNEALAGDSASVRRRFFDRLCSIFDTDHATRTATLDRRLRERERLLEGKMPMSGADRGAWLRAIEENLAALSVSVCAARMAWLRPLSDICGRDSPFIRADLALDGKMEEWLGRKSARATEEHYRAWLADHRRPGQCDIGAHRSILSIRCANGHGFASTGQEKALALRLLCAAAELFAKQYHRTPIILIDETVAHFDETTRLALFSHLDALGAQVWMSGTHQGLFSYWRGKAQFVEINNGTARPCAKAR